MFKYCVINITTVIVTIYVIFSDSLHLPIDKLFTTK